MDIIDKDLYNSVKNGTMRTGKFDLLRHLEGKRLIRSRAIRAKCYDCNGMGEQNTCDDKSCPLHPYSQFKPEKVKEDEDG